MLSIFAESCRSCLHHRTLFDRIGGAEAIDSLVEKFYSRVLNDPELRIFSQQATIDRLKHMQKLFFNAVLDGPALIEPLNLAHIHQHLGITRSDFGRFVNHLIDVLEAEHMIQRGDATEIVFRIATYTDEITGLDGYEDG